MSLPPKATGSFALTAFAVPLPAQYPGTPGASALRIRKPCPTTHMHGPPCFVVDAVLAVSALVHLDVLQSLGQVNCAQTVIQQLKQGAALHASRGFVSCVGAFDEAQDAEALG